MSDVHALSQWTEYRIPSEILEDLTSDLLNCVVAVRALDEGVDLPSYVV